MYGLLGFRPGWRSGAWRSLWRAGLELAKYLALGGVSYLGMAWLLGCRLADLKTGSEG